MPNFGVTYKYQFTLAISRFQVLINCFLISGFKIDTVQYRNADFMSIGLLVLNIYKMKSQNVKITGLKKYVLKALAISSTIFYRFGKQELIITVSKL